MENIRSEIDYEKHCALGLGRRMPLPKNLTLTQAHNLKDAIYNRVVFLWGRNQDMSQDPDIVLKVTQCIAEDEVFAEAKLESEQIELLLHTKLP